MERSRACTSTHTQTFYCAAKNIPQKYINLSILHFKMIFPLPIILDVFQSECIFSAVYEQIQYNTECAWFQTFGSILRTHCVSAVNSQSVLCISAVFGPILELTQETGPFWQPPRQPVLHTAEPSVACTYIHMHIHVCTCTHILRHAGIGIQPDRPDFSMLTTYQCFIHFIDFHESFNILFKSTCLPSSLCSLPVFHKPWLERPLTKAPRCVTWRASCSPHLVLSIAHFKPCSAGVTLLLSELKRESNRFSVLHIPA